MVNTNAEDLLPALIGGIIIGLATTINLSLYGRITGNSGIFNALIKFNFKEGFLWKLSFFSGICSAGYLFYICTDKGKWENDSFTIYFFDPMKVAIGDLHVIGWIIAGILVGIGTKMGNGWTSGHGVCGIPRLSVRSITAVWVFMGTAISLATFRHYVPFLDTRQSFGEGFEDVWPTIGGALVLAILVAFIITAIVVAIVKKGRNEKLEMPISYLVGFIFGWGLVISGMWRRTKIANFLTLYEDWDPSLMLVMGGAVGVNIFTFQLIIRKQKVPVFAEKLCIPQNKSVDFKLLIGAGLFGLGWGLGSLCPGPGMIDFFLVTHLLIWMPWVAIGQIGWELTEITFNKFKTAKVNGEKVPGNSMEVKSQNGAT